MFFGGTAGVRILLFEIVSHVGPLYTKMQTGIDRVNRIVQENLTAVRVVRSYVRENYEQAKFDDANLALRTESEKPSAYLL